MRPLLLTLAALALEACQTGPCQELGERVCACSGIGGSACTTQVQDQLKASPPDMAAEDRCVALLGTCNAPAGAQFCEWLVTEDGKVGCGLAADPGGVSTTSP
jgi:hypothetical protein